MKFVRNLRVREAIFFGGLILAGAVWFAFPWLRLAYSDYRARQLIYEMERPYREDVYGGLTPEATYALFIDALKAGDIELASKYFSPKRQEGWLKELKAQKDAASLNEFIRTLPDISKWKKEEGAGRTEFYLTVPNGPEEKIKVQGKEFTIPPGPRTYEVIFLKNDFTKKWKIESL